MRVFTDMPLHPDAVAAIERDGTLVSREEPAFPRWPEEADALIFGSTRLDAETLAGVKRLKIAAKHGVGLDSVDLVACRRHGIRVTWTPGGNARAVAELAIGLALALARHVITADNVMRPGGTVDRHALVGTELRGSTVGLVGLGHIGRAAAAMAGKGLGMTAAAFDPHLTGSDWPADVVRYDTLHGLLAAADLVIVATPLNEETRHLISTAALRAMKPSARLVNVARGGLVDDAALADALARGALAGAASDVFSNEPAGPDHPLLAQPTFIATRHIGGYTGTALRAIGLACVGQIRAVLAGEEPADPVL